MLFIIIVLSVLLFACIFLLVCDTVEKTIPFDEQVLEEELEAELEAEMRVIQEERLSKIRRRLAPKEQPS